VPFAHYARATPAPISAITGQEDRERDQQGPTKMKESVRVSYGGA